MPIRPVKQQGNLVLPAAEDEIRIAADPARGFLDPEFPVADESPPHRLQDRNERPLEAVRRLDVAFALEHLGRDFPIAPHRFHALRSRQNMLRAARHHGPGHHFGVVHRVLFPHPLPGNGLGSIRLRFPFYFSIRPSLLEEFRGKILAVALRHGPPHLFHGDRDAHGIVLLHPRAGGAPLRLGLHATFRVEIANHALANGILFRLAHWFLSANLAGRPSRLHPLRRRRFFGLGTTAGLVQRDQTLA